MKANKMKTVKLITATPIHIGSGNRVDRFDDKVEVDYKQNKITINDYQHDMFIEDKDKLDNLVESISANPQKRKRAHQTKVSKILRGKKFLFYAFEDLEASASLTYLFDNQELLPKLTKKDPSLLANLDYKRLKLTSIEYLNVAMKNPVRTLPYNGSHFYLPASSLKGAIKAMNTEKENEVLDNDLLLNKSLSNIKIIDRNSLMIEIVKKIEVVDDNDNNISKIRVQKNKTNIKQFVKPHIELELSINERILQHVLNENKNNVIKQRLEYVNEMYNTLFKNLKKEQSIFQNRLQKATSFTNICQKDFDVKSKKFKEARNRTPEKKSARKDKEAAEIKLSDAKIAQLDIQIRVDAINSSILEFGLNKSDEASYKATKISKNITSLISDMARTDRYYMLLGGNKGKQLLLDDKLDKFGLNFIDHCPIGIAYIEMGDINECI